MQAVCSPTLASEFNLFCANARLRLPDFQELIILNISKERRYSVVTSPMPADIPRRVGMHNTYRKQSYDLIAVEYHSHILDCKETVFMVFGHCGAPVAARILDGLSPGGGLGALRETPEGELRDSGSPTTANHAVV